MLHGFVEEDASFGEVVGMIVDKEACDVDGNVEEVCIEWICGAEWREK